jgi:glutathione S-transferase
MTINAQRKLYDLAGADPDRRFSPYCWRTRLALAHKDLPVETIPWRFTEKEAIARSGQHRVPVLLDGETVVWDSWTIATYLEDTYGDGRSLFGGAGGRSAIFFINNWADSVLLPGIARLIVVDVWAHLHDKDRAYFRETREKIFGMSLEQVCADRETSVEAFRMGLRPLQRMLAQQPFFGGSSANYGDYIVFGGFQWARCTSRFQLLAEGDPIAAWFERILDLFGGLARAAPSEWPV